MLTMFIFNRTCIIFNQSEDWCISVCSRCSSWINKVYNLQLRSRCIMYCTWNWSRLQSRSHYECMCHISTFSTHRCDTSVYKKVFYEAVNITKYNPVLKQFWSIRNYENGFHSPIFVLDESHFASSMFVSLMTNVPKCTSRLCLSTGYFCRAAEKTLTQRNIE